MKKPCIIIIAAAILFANLTTQIFAEERGALSVGLKSRIDQWKITKNHYGSIGNSDTYFDPDVIEQKKSDTGLLLGPEIEYSIGSVFIRGSYLIGNSNFTDSGSGKRTMMGADVGIGKIGGAFLGYRSMKAGFNNINSTNITDHSISDAVFGFFLRKDPDTPGFHIGIEMLFGLKAILNSFKTEDGDLLRNPSIFEAEVKIGCRLHSLPLRLDFGYGFWDYEDLARESKTATSLITFNNIERWENISHGGIVNAVYSF